MNCSRSLVRGNLHLNLVIHSGKVKFRDQCSSCYQAIVYLLLLFCFTFTPYNICAISSQSLQSILNTHLCQKKHNIIHYSSLIHYYTHLISCKTLSSSVLLVPLEESYWNDEQALNMIFNYCAKYF